MKCPPPIAKYRLGVTVTFSRFCFKRGTAQRTLENQ